MSLKVVRMGSSNMFAELNELLDPRKPENLTISLTFRKPGMQKTSSFWCPPYPVFGVPHTKDLPCGAPRTHEQEQHAGHLFRNVL